MTIWTDNIKNNRAGYSREFYELLMEQHEGNVGVCLQIMSETEKDGERDSLTGTAQSSGPEG